MSKSNASQKSTSGPITTVPLSDAYRVPAKLLSDAVNFGTYFLAKGNPDLSQDETRDQAMATLVFTPERLHVLMEIPGQALLEGEEPSAMQFRYSIEVQSDAPASEDGIYPTLVVPANDLMVNLRGREMNTTRNKIMEEDVDLQVVQYDPEMPVHSRHGEVLMISPTVNPTARYVGVESYTSKAVDPSAITPPAKRFQHGLDSDAAMEIARQVDPRVGVLLDHENQMVVGITPSLSILGEKMDSSLVAMEQANPEAQSMVLSARQARFVGMLQSYCVEQHANEARGENAKRKATAKLAGLAAALDVDPDGVGQQVFSTWGQQRVEDAAKRLGLGKSKDSKRAVSDAAAFSLDLLDGFGSQMVDHVRRHLVDIAAAQIELERQSSPEKFDSLLGGTPVGPSNEAIRAELIQRSEEYVDLVDGSAAAAEVAAAYGALQTDASRRAFLDASVRPVGEALIFDEVRRLWGMNDREVLDLSEVNSYAIACAHQSYSQSKRFEEFLKDAVKSISAHPKAALWGPRALDYIRSSQHPEIVEYMERSLAGLKAPSFDALKIGKITETWIAQEKPKGMAQFSVKPDGTVVAIFEGGRIALEDRAPNPRVEEYGRALSADYGSVIDREKLLQRISKDSDALVVETGAIDLVHISNYITSLQDVSDEQPTALALFRYTPPVKDMPAQRVRPTGLLDSELGDHTQTEAGESIPKLRSADSTQHGELHVIGAGVEDADGVVPEAHFKLPLLKVKGSRPERSKPWGYSAYIRGLNHTFGFAALKSDKVEFVFKRDEQSVEVRGGSRFMLAPPAVLTHMTEDQMLKAREMFHGLPSAGIVMDDTELGMHFGAVMRELAPEALAQDLAALENGTLHSEPEAEVQKEEPKPPEIKVASVDPAQQIDIAALQAAVSKPLAQREAEARAIEEEAEEELASSPEMAEHLGMQSRSVQVSPLGQYEIDLGLPDVSATSGKTRKS